MENIKDKKQEKTADIKSFRDLRIYQGSYKNMMVIIKNLLPLLPDSEKNDLKSQLSRSSKAIPRLIAEGYAKRHQRAGFQKYLDDAMAECNETVVSLEQCKDLYLKEPASGRCKKLSEDYEIIGRQIYKLTIAWSKFKKREGVDT